MISVEVYECDATADEAAAVHALRHAKNLDDYHASQPFGLLHWHKRPFSIPFASVEEARRFIERLQECGYRSRLAAPEPDPA
jgi:hypothetical protein